MKITLEVPDHLVDHDPTDLAKRIKLYAALLMFQSDDLSAGAAAELAEVDRFTFAAECEKHGIPVGNYSSAALRAELAGLGIHPEVERISGLVPSEVNAEGVYLQHLLDKYHKS